MNKKNLKVRINHLGAVRRGVSGESKNADKKQYDRILIFTSETGEKSLEALYGKQTMVLIPHINIVKGLAKTW